jgi:outer membrane protein assembly factor BamB
MSTIKPTNTTVWQTSGGDNSRRGLFNSAINIAPKPKRRLKAQGSIQTPVIFDQQGTAFITDMAGGVQAYCPKGNPIWSIQLDSGISAAPVLQTDDERLFVGTHNGMVYALDASNGKEIWHKEIPSKQDTRILSDFLFNQKNNTFVLNSWGGKFYSLNAKNGDVKNSWDAGISPYAGASANRDGELYCLRAVWDKGIQFVRIGIDGQEKTLFQHDQQKKPATRLTISAEPVLDEKAGVIYFITNIDQKSYLNSWSIKNEKILWKRSFAKYIYATPTLLTNGAIIIADLNGDVHAISQENTRLYRYATGCEYLLSSAVSDANDNVYIGDPLGILHKIGINGIGKPLYEAERSIQARPSFDKEGSLYMPSTDKYVYVF